MIIPSTPEAKERKVKYIADTCLDSQTERLNAYLYRRAYFLFGSSDDRASRVLYNRLQSHTDLVASFLFSADHAEYELSAPSENAEEEIAQQCAAAQTDWNNEFRDSGLAQMVADAILWALIYDSMFIKVGWNQGREQLTSVMVPPYNFGVYDESEDEINNQHAFCHVFTVDYDEACQRLIQGGLEARIPELRAAADSEKPTLPAPLSLMISNAQRQHVTDPVIGKVTPDYLRSFRYQAEHDTTRVRFKEVWIWDDEATDDEGEAIGDYRRFVCMDPDIILEDSRDTIAIRKRVGMRSSRNRLGKELKRRWTDTNDFIPGSHPFTHICPFGIYDYFFGECHTERLIPLQDWTTTRLSEIHEILDMQVDPPRSFAGFLGLTDEKAEAFHGPGSWVTDQNPGAKVESHIPEMPPDLFREVMEIGKLFLEASGLTETLTGQGGEHIRSGQHAKKAAITGSSRIKKTAISLEPALVSLGDTAMRLRQAREKKLLRTDSGNSFALSQMAASDWKMRISGHSHSPLFADDGRELAAILFKAQAIDREALLRMLHPPRTEMLVRRLRHRVQREAAQAAANPEAVKGKGRGGPRLAAG
jgi:hypothetical protein